MEPDPSSLVLIPTLPPHLHTLVSNSLGPEGQDTRSNKLPVSLRLLCSPYTKSPPRRMRSGDQMGHVAPGTPPPFTMQDSNFLAMRGATLESGQRLRPSMRQRHCQGVGVVVVLNVLQCPLCNIPCLTIPHRYKTPHLSPPCPCLQIFRTQSL